jgi:hypothetical protein
MEGGSQAETKFSSCIRLSGSILLFDRFGSDDPEDYLAGFPLHLIMALRQLPVLAG